MEYLQWARLWNPVWGEAHLLITEGQPRLECVPSQSGSQFLKDLSGRHYDPQPRWQIVLEYVYLQSATLS